MEDIAAWTDVVCAVIDVQMGFTIFLWGMLVIFGLMSVVAILAMLYDGENLTGLFVTLIVLMVLIVSIVLQLSSIKELAAEGIYYEKVSVAALPNSLDSHTPIFVETNTTAPYYIISKEPGVHSPIKLTLYCSRAYLHESKQSVLLLGDVANRTE
jgi:hypothetical protein